MDLHFHVILREYQTIPDRQKYKNIYCNEISVFAVHDAIVYEAKEKQKKNHQHRHSIIYSEFHV